MLDVLTQQDVIVRMHDDLQRALAKKPEEPRWVMVIDLRKCVGCHSCTIACDTENHLPPVLAPDQGVSSISIFWCLQSRKTSSIVYIATVC